MGITRDLVEYDRNIQYVPFKVPKTGVLDTDDWGGVDYDDPDAIGANPVAKIYPDGTIVGSTDNGSYTRWANGELECSGQATTITTTVATGGIAQGQSPLFTYPIEFIATPSLTPLSSRESGYTFAGLDVLTATPTRTLYIRVLTSAPVANAGYAQYIAKGKWK